MKQVLSIYELSGRRTVLGGAILGKEILAKLITAVKSPPEPEAVLLDFKRVDVATGSFLREAVLGYRNYCTRTQPDIYPVVADANDVIIDELDFLLKLNGDALVVCALKSGNRVKSTRILGQLHEKQQLTFDAVLAAGETDAAALESQFRGSEQIQITGWNNRLSSLVAKGLLMEVRKGRSKVYRPVVE